ncbi:hypothetical protein RVF83_02045 [Gordonia rubripertincta]|uniref:LLM class flavin-dependent oxidoreductase n=2 Tax=Gordonia rubripertincta TaxID=36822 RepID=A0AAW6RAS8_GORRU|nr:hypothetical protein [Gordonia rubripertincta]MBM7276770.1 hypothetical protein [Gordonia rubripertincta]MDG6781743.1 hypothetical protein [Gordonia rubripertincta]NKY65478.1 hypothetical protein [Gordonia rubripertincta]GAB85365.1 hypothetical protein GORBP_059_00610 [Gordonia rubripertincta NBRC 101908]
MTVQLDTPRNAVTIGRPGFQVAIAGDAVAQTFPIIVRRETLRDAQRARSLLRAGTHDQANFVVALEIEVAIAPNAASARAAVEQAGIAADNSDTIRYVGTTHGLITLLRDIYAAEVADAVILVPIDGSATDSRIREQVLPAFADIRHRVA